MVTDGYWYSQLKQVLSSLRCQKPRSGYSRLVAKSSSGMLSGFRSLVDSTITYDRRSKHRTVREVSYQTLRKVSEGGKAGTVWRKADRIQGPSSMTWVLSEAHACSPSPWAFGSIWLTLGNSSHSLNFSVRLISL